MSDATCEEASKCQREGCTYSTYVEKPANGHNYGTWIEEVPATCTADGKTQGKHCSVCNTVIIAQIVVAAKGHTLGVGANCTDAQICTVCKTELVAALGHDYKSNIIEAFI